MRTRIPAPVGCLLLLVLLPLVLIGGLLFVVLSLFRGLFSPGGSSRVGGSSGGTSPGRTPIGGGRAPADLGREVALCSLVRGLALDDSFTREQALMTPVIAPPGAPTPPTEELLADAERRGWITGPDEELRVTSSGRTGSQEFLDRAGL